MSSLSDRRALAPHHDDLASGSISFAARAASWVRAALKARRQRQQLLALDDRMLADIGVSRADAYREATRGYGDLPQMGWDGPRGR
jgi:uncharacterized protein YjiS (DUF1127 family)